MNNYKSKRSHVEMELTASIATTFESCQHGGWYVYPKFWIFKRRYLCCDKCGELIPKGRWFLD